jgi:hypothetical protein
MDLDAPAIAALDLLPEPMLFVTLDGVILCANLAGDTCSNPGIPSFKRHWQRLRSMNRVHSKIILRSARVPASSS